MFSLLLVNLIVKSTRVQRIRSLRFVLFFNLFHSNSAISSISKILLLYANCFIKIPVIYLHFTSFKIDYTAKLYFFKFIYKASISFTVILLLYRFYNHCLQISTDFVQVKFNFIFIVVPPPKGIIQFL